MTNLRCGIALTVCAALLGDCSGGSRSSTSLVPTATQASRTNVTFVINATTPQSTTLSRATTSARGVKPQYLSPATKSISIAITGPTNVTQTQDLTLNSSGCTSTLASAQCTLIVGLAPCTSPSTNCYTASLTIYDQTGGAGNVLSAAQTIAFTVTAGQSNSVNLALSGVPAKTLVVPANFQSSSNGSNSFDLIGRGAHSFVAESLDADGNIIVGVGAPLFTIGTPSGALSGVTTSPSTTIASAPNAFVVTPPTTFSSNTASFTVTPTFAGQPTDGCAQPGAACAPVTITVAMKYLYLAYVSNYDDSTISAYTIDATTGALTPVAGTPSATGTNPFGLVADPSGKFVYVANTGTNIVSAYAINAATGALTPLADSPFATGSSPFDVAVDPTGKFAYVTNSDDNTVSAYTINATTGALTSVSGSPFAAATRPIGVVVDPTGKFAYVTNETAGTVSAYTISAATGALTPVSGSPFAAGISPFGAAVDPTGKFLYVPNLGSIFVHTVSAYTIDAATGALTPIGGSPFATGNTPNQVAVDPTGKFVYVVNQGDNNVSGYTINATTGALTPMAGSPFATGRIPIGITIDPKGTFAYVADSGDNTVSAYTINATTGALTPMVGSPFATGHGPYKTTIVGIP